MVKKQQLSSGFYVEPITKAAYDYFRQANESLIFPNRFDINAQAACSAEESAGIAELNKNLQNLYELRLGFFHDGNMVGWHYGVQVTADTYRMVTTGILPAYQRKGIYSAFLAVIAEQLREAGFQIILSRHYATDNQVIIPKLRFGFLVSGFEVTDEYGLLLRLNYYFNETRRKIFHVRSGFQQPDDVVKSLIRKYD